jgi:hypothetical protein
MARGLAVRVSRLFLASIAVVLAALAWSPRAFADDPPPAASADHEDAGDHDHAGHDGDHAQEHPGAADHDHDKDHAAAGDHDKPGAAPPAHAGDDDDEGGGGPSDALSDEDEKEGSKIALTHDKEAYAAFIRKIVPKVRDKVLEKLETKMIAKHDKKMGKLAMILSLASLSGFLLLLMPIFLATKYPGQMGTLVKSSAVAAVTAVIVLNLFAGVVFLVKSVQGMAARQTNPTLLIVEATFNAIEADADDLVEFGPQLIQPTLDQMESGDGIMAVALLENVKKFAKDAEPFITAASWLRGATWMFEYIPIITTIITILVFLLGAKTVMKELASLPGKAASGGDQKAIIAEAFRYVGRELVAALGLVVAVLVLAMVSAEALSAAVHPAMHDVMTYLFENIRYIQTPDCSTGLVYASLLSVIMSLVLAVAILVLSSTFWLGKVHKILQARMHQKIPLGAHKKFWIWGTLTMLLSQAYPFLFSLAIEPVVDKIDDMAFGKEEPSWSMVLLSGPLVMVVGFLLLFWIIRGMKGLVFTLKYKPLEAGKPAAAPAPAAA